MFSIIVPTYNEAGNIQELSERVFGALSSAGIKCEMVVVDDNSSDHTQDKVNSLEGTYPIRLIERTIEKGLASAVIEGLKHITGDVVAIMDADLSHPPEALPQMYSIVESNQADIVIGSRLVKGGGASNWPWYRRFISFSARLLTIPLTSVKDSTSGFIVFKRSIIERVKLNPIGFKIGLEIICRARQNRAVEVPIIFADRKHGQSKLKAKPIFEYLEQLTDLYRDKLKIK